MGPEGFTPPDVVLGAGEAQTMSYGFLEAMSHDNPELAERINGRVKGWAEQVDTLAGVEGIGDAVLNNMEYISKAEVMQHLDNVTHEIRSILEQDEHKRITLVTIRTDGGSQVWMHSEIQKRLGTELAERVSLITSDEVSSSRDTEFFFVDDSINSGKQFNRVAQNIAFACSENGTQNYVLRVRCLRINRDGLDYNRAMTSLRNQRNLALLPSRRFANYVSNEPLKTTKAALDALGITRDDLNNAGLVVNTSPHTAEYGTLTLWWHKVQDNMPPVLIQKNEAVDWNLIKKEEEDMVASPYGKHY